jgi:hypothetical protein
MLTFALYILNNVHFDPEATPMQTLVSQLTTTFVDDAIEVVKGFGKVIVHIATAPIERIANACDVGGILARRQSARRLRATTKAHRPRSPWKRSLSPFASLHHLT